MTATGSNLAFTFAAAFASIGLAPACSAADDAAEAGELGAQIEPDCSLAGDVFVELGEDRGGFAPLLDGEEPMLYHGAQGGTHLILAGRVTTPDPLDRYEIALKAEIGDEGCVDDGCDDYVIGGQIMRVIEGPERTVVYDDATDLPYLFLVVDGWDPNRIRKLTLDVSDACGRSATDVRFFDPAP